MDAGRSIRIMLVEDYRSDLERTLDALRKRNLAKGVRVARGGQEALDYLYGRGQFEDRRRYPLPDVVLLDLNMPVVDGYMVLRQLKHAEYLDRIPVIVLAMSHEEGRRAMAYESHAQGYLVKPVFPESLDDLGLSASGLDRTPTSAPSSPDPSPPRQMGCASACAPDRR